MTTLSDLVEEIQSNLQGFTASLDQVTSLAANAGTTDTTLSLADCSGVSRGIIEVDEELMWVQSVDPQANTVTLLPKGRGWKGSTATAHTTGATVAISPTAPRAVVIREIRNQINALYPSIFAVKTTEFPYNNYVQSGWQIPADAEAILDVRYRDPFGNWQRVRQWEIESSMDTTDFSTGKALRLSSSGQWPNATVQVVYATPPTQLVALTDDFTTTGLNPGAKDLVVLGAMVRLVPMFDVARLSVQAAPADELDQPRPLGSALLVADKLRAQYQQRLVEERRILSDRYPARIHFTR